MAAAGRLLAVAGDQLPVVLLKMVALRIHPQLNAPHLAKMVASVTLAAHAPAQMVGEALIVLYRFAQPTVASYVLATVLAFPTPMACLEAHSASANQEPVGSIAVILAKLAPEHSSQEQKRWS